MVGNKAGRFEQHSAATWKDPPLRWLAPHLEPSKIDQLRDRNIQLGRDLPDLFGILDISGLLVQPGGVLDPLRRLRVSQVGGFEIMQAPCGQRPSASFNSHSTGWSQPAS